MFFRFAVANLVAAVEHVDEYWSPAAVKQNLSVFFPSSPPVYTRRNGRCHSAPETAILKRNAALD